MKSLNDIATELRSLAAYSGGEHYTFKEIETKLNEIASELDELNFKIVSETDIAKKMIQSLVGLDDEYLFLRRKQKDIESRNTPAN